MVLKFVSFNGPGSASYPDGLLINGFSYESSLINE